MELVEREDLLEELNRSVDAAAGSRGQVVFLGGAAGMGKTSVVAELRRRWEGRVRVLLGACDALATPRALGPLHDMAVASPILADLLSERTDRHLLFTGILDEMRRRTILMIIEDLHWADEATLDLVRFIGRRVHDVSSLLVATYRNDEVHGRHPLRSVLGDLATAPGHRRLTVPPLSREGVGLLAADHPIDPGHLHTMTGGNPFYVTEVLAAPGWTVPPTVTDAVLARARRVPDDVRTVLEAVSVEPGPAELWLLEEMNLPGPAVDGALASGMLRQAGEAIVYRHEIARLAMRDTVGSEHRRDLHRRILDVLERRTPDQAARLAHHAREGGDDRSLLRWGIEAGRAAVAGGAHREAATHLHDALHAHDRLPPEEALDDEHLDDLLEELAVELSAIDRRGEALEVRQRLVELRSRVGDEKRLIVGQVDLAYMHWINGEGDIGRALVAECVRRAEVCGDRAVAAHAYAGLGYISMLTRDAPAAIELCTRAIDLAEGVVDDPLVRALNARGSARICPAEDLGGIEDLERSSRIALERGWDHRYNDALENLGSALGEIRRYDLAIGYLEQGIDFAIDRDLDSAKHYGIAWLARIRFERGEWDRATELARETPTDPEVSPISPIVGLTVLGRIRARRGDPGSMQLLDQAWEMALRTNDLQRLWPVAAARAEAAWLAGRDTGEVRADVARVLDMAHRFGAPWAIGEMAFWAWKLELPPGDLHGAAEPFRLHIAGRHGDAARQWHDHGCPYEEAWALADSDEESLLRQALDILLPMGARPLAEIVRQSLRQMGATSVPSGPRASTAGHPAGLTARQAEVLSHLAEGLTDRAIADQLHISPKTVGHHVSAILRKLGAANRAEAAARARDGLG